MSMNHIITRSIDRPISLSVALPSLTIVSQLAGRLNT
jgi:hypothetical protein